MKNKLLSFFVFCSGILICAAVSFGFSVALMSCESSSSKNTGVSQDVPVKEVESKAFNMEDFIQNVRNLAKSAQYESALSEYAMLSSGDRKKIEGNYDAFFLKAQLLSVTNKIDESLEICNKISEKKQTPELKNLIFSLTKRKFMNQLQNAESDQAALALYDNIYPELAEDFNIILIKASLQVAVEKYNDAEKTCALLDSISPDNIDVMEIRLMIAEKKGNVAAKNEQLNKIVKKDPYNASANIELAENQAVRKNYKQAKTYYQKALVKNPENQDALFGLGQMDYYLENDDKAKATFNKLLEVNPENSQAYSYLGKLAFANDEYKVARDYIEQALKYDDSNYDYYMDYGQYLRYTGKFAEAEKAWSRAIELDPDYFLAYAYRAGIYDEQDKFKEALADYQKVIQLNPKYYYAYESLGILALHEQRWEEAGKAFFECRKYNQENISYPLMVTYCYYMLGREAKEAGNGKAAKEFSDKAKKYSNDILRKMGNINSMDYKMLRVYHDENGYQLLSQQIAALGNVNQRGKMYFYLGLLYDMFGIKESAKEYYSKVISMNSPMFFEYRLAEWAIKENITSEN